MESSDYKINKVILSKSANIGDITRKGVRIKFYRNGDTFFRGFEFSFCQHNYKNLDYLLDELNRSVLCDQSILPYGIRVIFTMRGRRVREIFGLKDGESYVVSSSNSFIPLQYEEIKENPSWRNIPLPNGKANVLNYTNASSRLISPIKDRIKKKFRGSPIVSMQSQDSNQGKLIYVVRNDIGRPREIYSWLISPKTAPNIEKVLNDLSSYLAMERGCLRRLVASDGTVISSMSKLHEKSSRVLFAFGSETYKKDDLKLSKEEKENLLKVINQKVTKSNSLKTFSMNEELERTKIQHFLPGYLELSSAVAYSGHNSIIKRCFDIKRKTEGFVKAIDVRKCTVTEKTRVGNEIFLMKIAKHPSIMSTSSHFTHEFFHFLVLEKIPETSLLETVINSNHHSEKFIASVVHSCASALDYLHSNRIVLRHLTMENIMTSKVAERLDVLKICDFSLATRLKQKKKLYEICGSPYYIAPEMLMETGYDSKVDVWSLGIVIFMLFHGRPPHHAVHKNHNEIFSKIVTERVDFSPSTWNHVGNDARCLIKFLLTRNPTMRFNSSAILKHSWVRNRLVRLADHDLRSYVTFNLENYVVTQKPHALVEHHPLVCTRLDNESLFFVDASSQEAEGGDAGYDDRRESEII